MPDFRYARGRIAESIQFIAGEIKEFETDYECRTWENYQNDNKLRKLMERTLENILTATIEVCGTILTEEGISGDSYADVIKKCAELLGIEREDRKNLAKLAIQRNRLAHRYLNYRWQAIKTFKQHKKLVLKLMDLALKREEEKSSPDRT